MSGPNQMDSVLSVLMSDLMRLFICLNGRARLEKESLGIYLTLDKCMMSSLLRHPSRHAIVMIWEC